MKIALDIERLTLRGVRHATVEEVTAAIENELAVLAEFYGLPSTAGRTLELDLAFVEIKPGTTGREAGRQIARQLMAGWIRQASDLKETPDIS